MTTLTVHHTLSSSDHERDAATLLAEASQLSKSAIKDAMLKGAVWLTRGKQHKRLRRATFTGQPGDTLSLYYDAALLRLAPPPAQLLADEKRYSVWIKAPGLLAQGTLQGDHCALLRLAEVQLKREVYLVHRLDREAAGLMLIAHDGKAAAAFSQLFASAKSDRLCKQYRVLVQGELHSAGDIALPLDGKAALTRYHPLQQDAALQATWLQIELVTGRKHQIRRHLAAIGHGVLGDPRYGSGNAHAAGLQLYATALRFTCPLTHQARHYQWEPVPGLNSTQDQANTSCL
ncbi:MAG: RluA family pseudouridine synthase [Pseudomonadales bacterium]|jgi:tRNA pseudouridine32 synthase/23S rRNA pseudouridine746 synthase|nr:RluA family pseudouridine synthase [Pseudomonadales bacterium]